MAALTALLIFAGYMLAGEAGLVIAIGIAGVMNFTAYWNADKIGLSMQGAREVTSEESSRLLSRFRDDTIQLARKAGLPIPKIYVVDTPQPNAFATGRNPQNAAVAATTGLLEQLNREEVMGVMAHELAHVENRDTLTMTVTATMAGAIGFLSQFALFFGGRNRGGFLVSILVMIFAPIAASLVQFAISRTREYSADKRGAEICGNPLWLASALEKIDKMAKKSVNQRAAENPAMAHLFIINPLNGVSMASLFSTHPPTYSRIVALEKMADKKLKSAGPIASGPWG